MTVSTCCGLGYVNDTSENHDIIMLDVDSKDISSGLSCPPPTFLDSTFLKKLSSRMNKGGMFVLNLVCRDSVLRTEIIKKLTSLWTFVVSYKLEEEVNEMEVVEEAEVEDANAVSRFWLLEFLESYSRRIIKRF